MSSGRAKKPRREQPPSTPIAPAAASEGEPARTSTAALARAIAAERRRTKAFADGHRLNVENVEVALLKQIEQLLAVAPTTPTAANTSPIASRAATADTQALTERLRERIRELVEERQELADRVAELAARPAPQAAIAPGKARPPAEGASFDWESQKRRMLAMLEAETADIAAGGQQQEDDEARLDREDERLTIDDTIQITDSVVAEKDREISELKQLLKDQSQNVGAYAVGAAALGEIFDSDEIIQHERARLAEAQVAVEEKLRVAEIEISQERAKIARERAMLDERRNALDTERERLTPDLVQEGANAPGRGAPVKNQRRWLTRLGLKETDASE